MSYDKTLKRLVDIFMRFFEDRKDEAFRDTVRFFANFVVFDEFANYLLFKIEEKTAIDDKTKAELIKVFKDFYEKEKKEKTKSLGIEYSFGSADEKILEFVDRLNDYYLGKFFEGDKRAKKEALRWMRDYYLKKGNPLGKGQKGISEFLKLFGDYLTQKSEMKARQIIDTTMNSVRNFAHVNSFFEAGIEKFRWDATNDRLTCPACRSLDGRIIETRVAKEQIDKVINSKPEDLPNIRPITTSYYRGKTSDFPLKTPPAHPLCRCTIAEEIEPSSVEYRIQRPDGVKLSSEQLELEEMFQNMTNDEINNKVKAHLGDVWYRVRTGYSKKQIKNMIGKAVLKHYEKHKKEFNGVTIDEYKKLPYTVIGEPDSIYCEVADDGNVYFAFFRDNILAIVSDDNMSISSVYKIKEEKWLKKKRKAVLRIY